MNTPQSPFDWRSPFNAGPFGPIFGGGAPAAVIYVDSGTGSDSNAGTLAAPLQTLSAATTAALAEGDGVTVALAAGREWRETLDLSSISGAKVVSYGDIAAGLPVVRGDDIVAQTWLTNVDRGDSNTGVYSLSWVHEAPTGQQALPPSVWQDDQPLQWVDSYADVVTTPGSFHHDNTISGSSPSEIHINPIGGINPNATGVFEITRRTWCVRVGDNARVENIHGRRQAHDNGAISGGDNGLIINCLCDGSPIHQMLFASGRYFGCAGVQEHGLDGRSAAIAMEFYRPDGIGFTGEWDTCIAVSLDQTYQGGFMTGLGGHTASSSTPYDNWTVRDCLVAGMSIGGTNVRNCTIERPRIINGWIRSPLDTADNPGTLTITDPWMHIDTPMVSGSGLNQLLCGTGLGTMTGLRLYSSADINTLFMMENMTVEDSSIFLTGTVAVSPKIFETEVGGGSVDAIRTIMDVAGLSRTTLAVSDRPTRTHLSGANVYHNGAFRRPQFRYGATVYDTVAAAQTAGREVGSVVENPAFVDPANGDFTTGTLSIAAGATGSPAYLAPQLSIAACEAWIIARAAA